MRSDAWFYNIFMYLYNKNILKYAQILVTSGRFMIFHIEGYSRIYLMPKKCWGIELQLVKYLDN